MARTLPAQEEGKMKTAVKPDFPVWEIGRYLEPGPIVLVRRLADDSLVDKYNFFIFQVVKAHVAASPKYPRTLHYTGNGVFTVSGKSVSRRALFRPENL
jgi:hypothetical protein